MQVSNERSARSCVPAPNQARFYMKAPVMPGTVSLDVAKRVRRRTDQTHVAFWDFRNWDSSSIL
jgi:hypothetical protein